jgi:hypothetical protein
MPRTQLSRTPLSKQAGVLRTSLLLSLGLSPLACGGSAAVQGGAGGSPPQHSTGGTRDPGTGGGTTTIYGGSPNVGGTSNVGGSGNQAGWTVAGGPATAGTGGTWTAGAGGTGNAGTSAGHGGAGGRIASNDCPDPTYNPTLKLTVCGNGRLHRPTAIACTYDAPGAAGAASGGAPGAGGASAGSGGVPSLCQTDAECAALTRGYCSREGNQAPVCKSGCVSDADCGAGNVCSCDGAHPGHCVLGGCTTDADCGPNSLCSPVSGVCGSPSFECTSSKDECISSVQCGPGSCALQGDHRVCVNAVCGRPFLVAEQARVADVEARADWLDATLTPEPDSLTPIERAQLAAHWARLGQMEHASIAAFARFNLQLLSLGAPSHLVEACNRALADETAHARSCFALASAYGHDAVGPARLDLDRCFEDASLSAIAKLVLREGCLGETVAALEAVAAAEIAVDPAVKQTLERIARDELTHAELAFQFLRWALSISSLEERHELACEAAQQLADFESNARHGERERTDDRLAAHGLLGSDALRAIRLAAARDVSRPLLAALFDVEETTRA